MEVGRGGEMVSSGVCAGEGRGEIDGRRRMSGRSGGKRTGGRLGAHRNRDCGGRTAETGREARFAGDGEGWRG